MLAAALAWACSSAASAEGVAPALLLLPATPPPGFTSGSIGYGIGVHSAKDSLPEKGWEASDPHVLCEVFLGRLLTATWTVTGRADAWPTTLPSGAECRNGTLSVPFGLGFRLGGQRAYVIATGALVVPHTGLEPLVVTWPESALVVSAIRTGPERGVGCGVSPHGEWIVQLGVDALAGPSTCELRLQGGTVVSHEVLVVRTLD
jgi:hypothetical protein